MRRLAIILPFLTLLSSGCKSDELEAKLAEATKQLMATEQELADTVEANDEQVSTFEERIRQLEAELNACTDQVDQLATEAGISARELADLRKEKAKRELELAIYKNIFAQLKALVDAGTVEIEFRKGRMVIKLANSILFDSGKTKLKDEGQAALAKLGPALASVEGRDFLIAGHTDNVPMRGNKFRSNWHLSTVRALAVVDQLIEAGMPAKHIGAAGFGEFDPVADNDTAEGQALNRRIEIILMPKLGNIPGVQELLTK